MKALPESRLDLIRRHLDMCKARVDKDEWESLQHDLDTLRTLKPSPNLNWEDGGVFKQESDADADFKDIEDLPERVRVEFERAAGVFAHSHGKQTVDDEHGVERRTLQKGSFVAVVAKSGEAATRGPVHWRRVSCG